MFSKYARGLVSKNHIRSLSFILKPWYDLLLNYFNAYYRTDDIYLSINYLNDHSKRIPDICN